MTQPGNFSLVGEGLNISVKDRGEPVTSDLPGSPSVSRSPAAPSRKWSSTSAGDHYVGPGDGGARRHERE